MLKLKTWIKYSTPECHKIVREILSSHAKGNGGVSTQEIYDLALKQFPDVKSAAPPEKFYPPKSKGRGGKIPMPVPEPPNREHPIRSMRYLKRIVLKEMEERNEVEKVYIRRGTLNEDGERMDMVVSKTSGREYRANVLIDQTHMWAWRLRQPDIPHTYQAQSPLPPSNLPPNSKRTPDWAGEYSAKRREGSLQPRFHMSWGAHWKGKSGARSFHFASASQAQLKYAADREGQADTSSNSGEWYGLVSRPVPFRENPKPSRRLREAQKQYVPDPPSSVSRTVTDAATQFEEETAFGLKRSLQDQGRSGSTSSASRVFREPVSQKTEATTQSVPSFQPQSKFLEEETAFGLKRSLQDQGRSGSNSSASRVFREPVSQKTEAATQSVPSFQPQSKFLEEEAAFGLKRSLQDQGRSGSNSSASRVFCEPVSQKTEAATQSIPSFQSQSKFLEEETAFGLKRSLQDQGRSGSNSSASRVFREPVSQKRSWSDAVAQDMPFGLASEASSMPAKPPRSDWDSSHWLWRSVHKTKAAQDGNSGHAWEDASLKGLLQSGKSEDDAVEFSTRYINRILLGASESSQWRRDPSSEMSPARRSAKSASERSVADSSTGDVNHQLSPSDGPRWYRKPNGGMWTFGVPKESSNASFDLSATRKPDVPFSQRLQQSRAAITKQVHKQLNSYATPIRSSIGRLPLYQSQNSYQSQQSTQSIAAAQPHEPPIIYAVVGSSRQQPHKQPSDVESRHKQSGVAKRTYDFPSFPTAPL